MSSIQLDLLCLLPHCSPKGDKTTPKCYWYCTLLFGFNSVNSLRSPLWQIALHLLPGNKRHHLRSKMTSTSHDSLIIAHDPPKINFSPQAPTLVSSEASLTHRWPFKKLLSHHSGKRKRLLRLVKKGNKGSIWYKWTDALWLLLIRKQSI